MTTRGPRAGFTLLEVMFATAIFSIVAASVATFFIGVQRLSRRAMATAELSTAMREMREKLLFHAQPAGDGVVWSGLLSGVSRGSSPIEAGIKVLVDAPVFTLDGGAVSLGEIQLLNDSGRFKNDGTTDPWRTLWFRFGGSVAISATTCSRTGSPSRTESTSSTSARPWAASSTASGSPCRCSGLDR